MSIIGSIFNFKINSCFSFKNNLKNKTQKYYEDKLLSIQNSTDIKVLPFLSFLPLTDIFPEKNHVADWSVYVIGKNKRLVIAQDNLKFSELSMLNKRYDSVLEGKNADFFQTVFEMIISGTETQFLMVCQERLYFTNTYTFKNENGTPIGGILFIRLYSSMTELIPKDRQLQVSTRKSREYERALEVIKENIK